MQGRNKNYMQAIYSYALLEENFFMLKPDANSVISNSLKKKDANQIRRDM